MKRHRFHFIIFIYAALEESKSKAALTRMLVADQGQHICRPWSAHLPTRVSRSADPGRQVANEAVLCRRQCRLKSPTMQFGAADCAV